MDILYIVPRKYKNMVLRFFSAIIFFLVWYSFVSIFNIAEYLLPNPVVVLLELVTNNKLYIHHFLRTGIEAALGFIVGNTFAVIVGLLLYRSNKLRHISMPAISALQAIPIVALAPLFIVWLGSGMSSKILMAATISFFPTLASILSSFEEVDHNAQQLFRLYRASYLTTVRHLLFPAALPSILTGLKVSAGLATVGAIVAEMTGSDIGIGYLILNASYRMETVKLFVGIFLAGTLGMIAFSLPNMLRLLYPQAWVVTRSGDQI